MREAFNISAADVLLVFNSSLSSGVVLKRRLTTLDPDTDSF